MYYPSCFDNDKKICIGLCYVWDTKISISYLYVNSNSQCIVGKSLMEPTDFALSQVKHHEAYMPSLSRVASTKWWC